MTKLNVEFTAIFTPYISFIILSDNDIQPLRGQ